MRRIKLWIVLALATITGALVVLDETHITPADNADISAVPSVHALAPDVTFVALNGTPIKLRSLAGHTVWLHFWASWCVPCREEFAGLLKHIQDSKEDIILLAVSADANPADAQKFLAPFMRNFKPLFDAKKVLVADDADHKMIENIFQTYQYPETIILSPDGRMQKKIAGVFNE